MIDKNHCVYVKRSEDKFVIISLYVNNILLAVNSKEFLITIKEWLSSNFMMKDMGEGMKLYTFSESKLKGIVLKGC